MMPESRASLSESRAILIGVDRYQGHDIPPYPAIINSLNGMHDMLINPAFGGWPDRQITEARNPHRASDLTVNIRELAKQATGTLLLYYVGHGLLTDMGELVLTTLDTTSDHPDVTGLEYRFIKDALLKSPARSKIVILDCCYAGEATRTLSGNNNIPNAVHAKGVYTLAASDGPAHVAALAEQGNAATSFTQELLDLICDGIEGEGEWLTLSDIYKYLPGRLKARALPNPNQLNSETAGDFPFTRNAAFLFGKTAKVDRPWPETAQDRAPTSLISRTTNIMSMAFAPVANHLATGSGSDGEPNPVRLWDVSTGQIIKHLPSNDNSYGSNSINSVAFSPNGNTIAASSNGVRLLHVDTGVASPPLPGPSSRRLVEAVAFSPDGTILAAGGMDRDVCLWDVSQEGAGANPINPLPHGSPVASLAFSPDGSTLATGGGFDRFAEDHRSNRNRGGIWLWDMTTLSLIEKLAHVDHTKTVTSMAFSPTGETLATATEDGTVILWDMVKRRHKETLRRPPVDLPEAVWPQSVAFTPDGETLATATEDDTVILWDMVKRRHKETLRLATAPVAFSSDGRILATTNSSDNTVRLWKIR